MKRIIALSLGLSLLIAGCDKKKTTSNNTTPSIDRRAKFIKTWTANYNCNSGTNANFQMVIEKDANDTMRFRITNFVPNSGTLVGILDANSDNIAIPNQALPSSGNTTIGGSMNYSSNTSTLSTNIQSSVSGGSSDFCYGSAF